ncbi:3' terminal RNA ribose 2'-O-methyltransferase Hen1 [Tamaricihabitans halophyticus]|uniref:Small RNA 2'-O-methyltransferase n=1 Tax=Tamaricihabitans halophyticus TaxID=1262583 RepID=A0A4V2ST07_9PSEU|nr:3' terminal RNA ribose 2'-O-methyltransferase Hen1 [Tamaricihabitans halophyticus]TCP48496.1 3' terminal RNA ribose 2'-O-methyltransferase Hen1 [Tamaricihabitans halophyticus]
MLVSITTTHQPATDLGYLLHKHPDRAQRFEVSTGTAHVFYPEASAQRCTATLLLDVDPIGLVRKAGNTLGQYVNDRPYAASSLLAVAIGKVFGTALRGRCDARPELAETPIPLEIHLPCCPSALAERLFTPLGWTVAVTSQQLDPSFADWGESPYADLRLTGTLRLSDALAQLYVLLPVLDDGKHYWVVADEIDKLLRVGANWLATHPDRELITTRYLAHQGRYAAEALERLTELDDRPAEDAEHAEPPARERSLAQQRRATIVDELRAIGAHRVVDMGCGEGKLLHELVAEPTFTEIVGVEVAAGQLRSAARQVERFADRQRERVSLHQGSVSYADPRIADFDAIVLSEVVEHIDLPRLPALAATVFGAAAPRHVLVTTPNSEYNVRWESLPAGHLRHPDHRFEWTRAELGSWADDICATHGYDVRHVPIGPVDPEVGSPTQLAVFTRRAA